MKKFVFLFAALLIAMTGLVHAAAIQGSVDPTAGPEVWYTDVYNNSSGDLDAGDVVVWNIDGSTGDNDNYVTTTTTAGTFLVAGVANRAIVDGDIGSIVIRGIVTVDVLTTGTASDIAAGTPLCTSTTAGSARNCRGNLDEFAFGHATASASGGTVTAYINP